MGTGLYIFLIDNDDRLHHIPMALYDRLMEFNSKESLPHFA